jgi:hypothetical protein
MHADTILIRWGGSVARRLPFVCGKHHAGSINKRAVSI